MTTMKVILTTCNPKDANELVRQLLTDRLVGCGNIVRGVDSMYWWNGEIQNDSEALILMETTDERCSAAIHRLTEIHPYDVPKILSLEPTDSLDAYEQWLRQETSS